MRPGTASNSQGSAKQKDMQFFLQLRSYPSFGEFALGGKRKSKKYPKSQVAPSLS